MDTKSAAQILVVASHPDDEVLGCGGIIAKHAAQGDDVHILLMSKGVDSREKAGDRQADKFNLVKAGQKASKILGARSFDVLDFPDNRMDSVDLLDIVKSVEDAVLRHRAKIVYTHHGGDLNIDHRITNQAVVTATRPLAGGTVDTVISFEVPSSTEWHFSSAYADFSPNMFSDISDFLDQKIMALNCYESEMRDWPHSRSYQAVEHLARWRGAIAGMNAAEAFNIIRMMNR